MTKDYEKKWEIGKTSNEVRCTFRIFSNIFIYVYTSRIGSSLRVEPSCAVITIGIFVCNECVREQIKANSTKKYNIKSVYIQVCSTGITTLPLMNGRKKKKKNKLSLRIFICSIAGDELFVWSHWKPSISHRYEINAMGCTTEKRETYLLRLLHYLE